MQFLADVALVVRGAPDARDPVVLERFDVVHRVAEPAEHAPQALVLREAGLEQPAQRARVVPVRDVVVARADR